MSKMLNKSKLLFVGLLIGSISMSSNAITKNQTIYLEAQIDDPASTLQVLPISGAWPAAALPVLWDHNTNSFTNPKTVGFKVKSSKEVTVALSSTAKLTSGNAMIPLIVNIKAGNADGISAMDLGVSSQKIYNEPTITRATPVFAPYELEIKATTVGMIDSNGSPISGSSPVPAAGNYFGSVDLVFESML